MGLRLGGRSPNLFLSLPGRLKTFRTSDGSAEFHIRVPAASKPNREER